MATDTSTSNKGPHHDSGLVRLAELLQKLHARTRLNNVTPDQLLLSGTAAALDAFEKEMNSDLGKRLGVQSFSDEDATIPPGRLRLHQTGTTGYGEDVADSLLKYKTGDPRNWQGEGLVFRTFAYKPLAKDDSSELLKQARQDIDARAVNTLEAAIQLTPTVLAARIITWLSELQENNPQYQTYRSLEVCANPLLDHAEGNPIWQADTKNGNGNGGPLLTEPPLGIAAASGGLAQANAALLERLDVKQVLPDAGQGVTVVILDTAPTTNDGLVDGSAIDPKLVDFWCDVQTVQPKTGEPEPLKPDPSCRCMPPSDIHKYKQNERSEAEIEAARAFGKKYHGMFAASLIKMLAPAASVLLLRVLNNDAVGDSADIMRAINLAMALRDEQKTVNGRRVVEQNVIFNLSLGLSRTLSEEVEACAMLRVIEAAAKQGAVFVAAAGNDSWYRHPRNPEEPAAYGYYPDGEFSSQMMICVSATDRNNLTQIAYFSNQGNIGAPAQHIIMETGNPQHMPYTLPGNGQELRAPAFVEWSGTSFATPLVAAAAARLLASGTAAQEIKNTLWRTAEQPKRWDGIAELRINQ